MDKTEIRWLVFSAAVAVGEGCAALLPAGAEVWPALVLAAAWVALMGYGFAVRHWPCVFLFLTGAALFYFATVETERGYRETPWMRGASRAESDAPRPSVVRDLSRRVGIGLEHDRLSARLNRAILLGERDGIPRATKRTFVEAGTVHVFAISGLHVMIVANVLMFVVALTFLPYRVQGPVALVPVWAYVLLIGSPPSAVRAGLMASFSFLAPLFCRRPNGVVSWSLAFLVTHVLFPELIANVGSQLSFVVMLAIVVAGRLCPWRFAGAIAAWMASVPIAAMTFGRITPGALLANLVVIGAAAYSVVAGVVGMVVSYAWEPLAVHLNNLSALMTDAMVGVSEVVARLPGSNFEIEPWTPLICALWYVAFALVLFLAARLRSHRNLV